MDQEGIYKRRIEEGEKRRQPGGKGTRRTNTHPKQQPEPNKISQTPEAARDIVSSVGSLKNEKHAAAKDIS